MASEKLKLKWKEEKKTKIERKSFYPGGGMVWKDEKIRSRKLDFIGNIKEGANWEITRIN